MVASVFLFFMLTFKISSYLIQKRFKIVYRCNDSTSKDVMYVQPMGNHLTIIIKTELQGLGYPSPVQCKFLQQSGLSLNSFGVNVVMISAFTNSKILFREKKIKFKNEFL